MTNIIDLFWPKIDKSPEAHLFAERRKKGIKEFGVYSRPNQRFIGKHRFIGTLLFDQDNHPPVSIKPDTKKPSPRKQDENEDLRKVLRMYLFDRDGKPYADFYDIDIGIRFFDENGEVKYACAGDDNFNFALAKKFLGDFRLGHPDPNQQKCALIRKIQKKCANSK